MRILAFSDVHGYVDAVKNLVNEVSDDSFDIIIFGGDFTNAWFEGEEEGQRQMNEIAKLLEGLERPLYYVYGNRDILVKCPIGYNIEEKDWKIGEYILTNNIEGLDKSKIFVDHFIELELEKEYRNAFLNLYGHDHVGRVYKNFIDLGFLYRRSETHGARESLYGCYWYINVEDGLFKVENHSWQLKELRCEKHNDKGVFYVPYYYTMYPLCYEEERARTRKRSRRQIHKRGPLDNFFKERKPP